MSTTEDHKEANVYEIGYLVLPSVPEENLPQVVSNLVSIIEKAGGKPLDGEDPALEPLAYSMSKTVGARKYIVDEAYVGWMKFDLPAEASAKEGAEHPVEAIRIGVDKAEEILRHLLIKAPRETVFTFAKARAEREARENLPTLAESEAGTPTPADVGATEETVKEPVVE